MNSKQMGSVIFLLLTLFITLALSGIPLLISNHPAHLGGNIGHGMGFEGFREGASNPKKADTQKAEVKNKVNDALSSMASK